MLSVNYACSFMLSVIRIVTYKPFMLSVIMLIVIMRSLSKSQIWLQGDWKVFGGNFFFALNVMI
jgi:hypothetical protein